MYTFEKTLGYFLATYILAVFISWPVNLYQLFFDCDWESPYRCEAVKGFGVFIPVISPVTVMIDDYE